MPSSFQFRRMFVASALAAPLVAALERQGWSVWWDRSIPPGRNFDEVLEEEIDAARCVVVVWTDASIDSQWVRSEALEGMERDILVPVRLDEDGQYTGFDDAPPTRVGGKADLVEKLAAGRATVMVGDGVTDLEAKSAGARVVGSGGVAVREVVRAGADAWVPGPSLLDVLDAIHEWDQGDG